MIGDVIKGVLGIGNSVAKGVFGDKAAQQKFQHEFELALLKEGSALIQTEINAQAKIVAAEAEGHSWLQRNWRPLTMLAFTIYMFATIFGLKPPDMTPEQAAVVNNAMTVIKIGIGGYVVGRSGEKIVKVWKNGAKQNG